MSTFLKTLIVLGIALPLAAFVAGSLVTASDESPPRERIIIQRDSTPTEPETAHQRRDQDPDRKPLADDADDVGEVMTDDGARRPAPADTDDSPARVDRTDDVGRAPGGGGGADDDVERDDVREGDDSGDGD
jgi:hypothetical protein